MATALDINEINSGQFSFPKKARLQKEVVCRILIVCEGEKTEPKYFQAFNKRKVGNVVYDLTLDGGGINTLTVVNKAIELRDNANPKFDRIWAVFDKDSFSAKNFNAAILRAQSQGIYCAWSNEAFELWYLLHFNNITAPMGREKYKAAISRAVNTSPKYKNKKLYIYQKNDEHNFEIMNKYGNQSNAIVFAEQSLLSFNNYKWATHNPCTKVHLLVLQLIGKDNTLNEELKNEIDNV